MTIAVRFEWTKEILKANPFVAKESLLVPVSKEKRGAIYSQQSKQLHVTYSMVSPIVWFVVTERA